MYTRILVALDGSEYAERVLPYVKNIASALSIPVRLLYAVEDDHPSISRSLRDKLHNLTSAHEHGLHARSYTEGVQARLTEEGMTVDLRVPEGEPYNAILLEASKDPDTLVAMSSHGRSGLARWWMGSVADRVLHLANNPLLLIHTQYQHPPEASFERLIVPVDGSEVAARALSHASHFSTEMGLPVDLITVVPSRAEYRDATSGFSISRSYYHEFNLIVTKQAEEDLATSKEQIAQYGVETIETKIMRGKPADEIANYAASMPGTLTIMTTHGRSGVGRMMLGSTAERVVRQAGVPVLLIRGSAHGRCPAGG